MNKYTIVLPVRNGGHYVKECVASILAQTLTGFDLVILENGSTDGTAEWLGSLTDPRIKVIPAKKPLNIAGNWSRILTIPKNEFVTLIGHDDLLLPHYLEEMDSLITRHPEASLYQSHFNFINAMGETIRPCLPMDAVQTAPELLACLTTHTLDSMGTGYLFRAKDYEAIGGMSPAYPDLLFADNALWISLTVPSYKATSFRSCFHYRQHQSLSRTTSGMDYYTSFTEYIKFLVQQIEADTVIKEVMARYGKEMLYELCQAVAHRLLKTPIDRRTITVQQFVSECEQHAQLLIPGQNFDPMAIKRIRLAARIDANPFLRKGFQVFRKNYGGKL